MKRILVLMAVVIFSGNPVAAQEAVAVNQAGSPLRIDSYSAAYNAGGRYTTEGINHSVSVFNAGDEDVVAYQIRFVSFDAFNEDMGRPLGGVSVDTVPVGGLAKGTWTHRAYAAFAFEKYGTGVAYVSKARLADGTVWTADQNFVLRELQKIKSDLTSEIFESAESGSGPTP